MNIAYKTDYCSTAGMSGGSWQVLPNSMVLVRDKNVESFKKSYPRHAVVHIAEWKPSGDE